MPKVLHIVESMDRGAIESWLVRMFRYAFQSRIHLDWTFYCVVGTKGEFDNAVQELGAEVIYSPVPMGHKVAFVRALRAELQRGRYDVLHCHHDIVSAGYLLAAVGMPITRRLVHVHNAADHLPTTNPIKRSLRPLMRYLCLAMADRIVAVSNHALDTFLAGNERRMGRDVVQYCGIDATPFEEAKPDRTALRRELKLDERSRIVLFAGRMVPEKNPLFALEVLAEMRRIDPAVAGVFAGSGSLDETARQRAVELGLDPAIRFLGWRSDIPNIMCCCDWFIHTGPEQPMEGFGLAVAEAQLAGLRLILSEGVSDDPLLKTAIFCRLPLSAGPQNWAKAALDLDRSPAPSRAAAVAALKKSPMEMDRALQALLRLYA